MSDHRTALLRKCWELCTVLRWKSALISQIHKALYNLTPTLCPCSSLNATLLELEPLLQAKVLVPGIGLAK